MPTPTFTTPPTAPSRTVPSFFRARMDAFLAWIVTCWGELTTAVGWMADRHAEVSTMATSAGTASSNAATAASNAQLRAIDASSSAAVAQAAAVAAQSSAGIPSAAGRDRRVLRSSVDNAVAFDYAHGRPMFVRSGTTDANRVKNSSSIGTGAAWARTNCGAFLAQGGPHGLGYTYLESTGVGALVYQPLVDAPVQGQQRCISVFYRSFTRPSAGALLSMEYLDVSNGIQYAQLLHSDPSLIFDGKWHRAGLVYTHAGSNLATRTLQVFVGAPSSQGMDVSAVQINPGSTPYEHFVCDSSLYVDGGAYLHVYTGDGPISITPSDSPAHGDRVRIKDVGGSFAVNPVTFWRNTKTIEGMAEDMSINLDRIQVEMVYSYGNWVIES